MELWENIFWRKILLSKYLSKPYFTTDATVIGYKYIYMRASKLIMKANRFEKHLRNY